MNQPPVATPDVFASLAMQVGRDGLVSDVCIVDAAEALGWRGEVRWPVQAHGVTFAAVCGAAGVGGPGSGWLAGCLVVSRDQTAAVQAASLLAGYSPRAVLVSDPQDVVDLQMQAALLDQGAVVVQDADVVAVSSPGDVVPSPLQVDDAWKFDEGWLELQHAVGSAPLIGEIVSPSM